MASPPLFLGLDTLILRVSNIRQAVDWYSRILGFPAVYEDPVHRLAVMDTHSPVSITLWQTDQLIRPDPGSSAYPIFRVESAARTHQALLDLGVRVQDIITDHAVTYFTFFDPDGNIIEACQIHE